MLDSLTLDQLRIFLSVAETGSFSATARRLGRVQSGISQSIRSMEEALRLELFERSGRTPQITPAGAALLREASDILGDVEALKKRAETLADGLPSQLALAVDQVFPSELLMEGLRSFSETFPRVPVALFTEGLGATEQRLRNDQARLAIYSPLLSDSKDLRVEFLAKVRIVPVVASSHPLAQMDGPISRKELRRHVQLMLTDRAQTVMGLVLSSRYWMFADQHSRLEYVQNGFGWSFAPLHFVKNQVERGDLKVLNLEICSGMAFSLPLYFVHLQSQPVDRLSKWLIGYLRSRIPAYRDVFIQPEDDVNSIPYPLEAMIQA